MPTPVAIAVAALVRDRRVLMVHRNPERRWYPDCWDLAGGHIEPGESPEQAVIRECGEELGVRIFDPRPIQMAFTDPGIEMHAFVVERWEGGPINAAPEEHDQLEWFGPAELSQLEIADPASLPDILKLILPGAGSEEPDAATPAENQAARLDIHLTRIPSTGDLT